MHNFLGKHDLTSYWSFEKNYPIIRMRMKILQLKLPILEKFNFCIYLTITLEIQFNTFIEVR